MTTRAFFYRAIRESSNTIKGYRLGQALFNALPGWATSYVAGTLFDPFYKDMSDAEAMQWIDDHLVFDGDGVLAVYNGNQILGERP